MSRFLYFLLAVALFALPARMEACTGIALSSANGARVLARTVEWAASPMQCGYAVVPRGYSQISFTPSGKDGIKFKAKYGYVGIYTDYQDFVVEGVNESGLSAGLFFFPAFGEYTPYVAKRKSLALCDLQVVSWVLSQFSSIDEIKRAIEKKEVDIISIDSRIGTVHWRFAEPGGRVVVLEFTEGKANFYENPLGVLTNSPNFPWHLTNLANYINLRSGSSQPLQLAKDLQVKPLGGGTGMLGLPGDFTPPSRFVRAAMLQSSAPLLPDAQQTALQAFHLLNSFDIPIGLQHAPGQAPDGLPSATQFTSATAITPAAGTVGPLDAIIIGLVGGVVCYFGVILMREKSGLDDALDVMGVHGIGGIWGAIATGMFSTASSGGLIYSGDWHLIAGQIVAIVFTLVFCFVVSYIIIFVIGKLMKGVRISENEEAMGQDIVEHGEPAYVM